MIILKPRLATFYVVLFVTIALLSNHMSAKPSVAQKPTLVKSSQTIAGDLN